MLHLQHADVSKSHGEGALHTWKMSLIMLTTWACWGGV